MINWSEVGETNHNVFGISYRYVMRIHSHSSSGYKRTALSFMKSKDTSRIRVILYEFKCFYRGTTQDYHYGLPKQSFGGRPAFPFGTGGNPRNCVRVRIHVRLPPCWKAWNFSKSYDLYIFRRISFRFSIYSFIFPSYFFIFPHIST